MARSNTIKVQVSLNPDLIAQIDEYAKAIGMSRSALCGFFIGQGIFSMNKGIEMAYGALQGFSLEDLMKSCKELDCKVD